MSQSESFTGKYSRNVHNLYLLSQKDVGKEENLLLKPFYLLPIFNVTNRNLLPKIDLHGNRNEIGKRMIECGRIEE